MQLVATGDALLTRRVSHLDDPGIDKVRELLCSADLAFTNLEMVLPDHPPIPGPVPRGLHVAGQPSLVEDLRWMGVGICSFANNHVLDYTIKGVLDSINHMAGSSMPFAGAGKTLMEARAPAFVETSAGRLALIAACSSTAETSLAADPSAFMHGRPGINPLRFSTQYHVTEAQFQTLQRIDKELGTAEAKRARVAASRSRMLDSSETIPVDLNTLPFAGKNFVVDDRPGIVTKAHRGDLDATTRAVSFARSQADVVAVSIHCHESAGDGWNSPEPPSFLVEACHRWVDVGADIIIGHGPHLLRGIEIYSGRPILYSLGNFFFTFETTPTLPREDYENQGLDPAVATVSDYFDAAVDGGFAAHSRFWQAIVAIFQLDGQERTLELVPISLGIHLPRHQRGLPYVSSATEAKSTLSWLQELSDPFGTSLVMSSNFDSVTATIQLP